MILLRCIFLLALSFALEAKEVFVLLGPPGSGKGTQALVLIEETDLPHISTGNLFREFLASTQQDNPLAKQLKGFMEKGELVPDRYIIEILKERISEPDAKNGYILDGFPRTLSQAKALQEILTPDDRLIVINLSVPDHLLLERLTGRLHCPQCQQTYHKTFSPPKKESFCDLCETSLAKRSDDEKETIQKRLEVYHKDTSPLIQFYKDKGVLYTIDAAKSKQEIQQQILSIYREQLKPASTP